MRVTLVISSLGAGGAERVMSIIANYWAAKGWPVTLLRLDDGKEPPFYELLPAVQLQSLDIFAMTANPLRRFTNIIQRFWTIRRAIRASRPDVVISFSDKTNIRTLLATVALPLPLVIAERSDPQAQKLGYAWELLRQLTYRWATWLVVQSQGARTYFGKTLQPKITVIPNPVRLPTVMRVAPHTAEGPKVCATMGRLSPEKGYDRLIQAFAAIGEQFPTWSLLFIGDGILRAELTKLAQQLGIGERVQFLGRLQNPFERLVEADLFVLSSHYEGFPNALCEAMACGLPAISFDCPSGPREIIRQEIDGLLVPADDVKALAAAMARLMGDAVLRQRLSDRAPEVTERFGLDTVMAQWEAVVGQAVQR